MTKLKLFTPSFILSIVSGLIGALLKILHLSGGHLFLIVSLVLTVAFVISGIYEIFSSNRISTNEKLMWAAGFVVLSTVTGFLYLFIGRPRIFRDYKILDNQNL